MKTGSPATGYRHHRAPHLAIAVLLTLVAASCGTDEEINGDPLTGTQWEMTTMGRKPHGGERSDNDRHARIHRRPSPRI